MFMFALGFMTCITGVGIYSRVNKTVCLRNKLISDYNKAEQDGFTYGPPDD